MPSDSGDSAAQTECGAWWHLPCHIGRLLRSLFIPSSTTTQSLGALWGSVSTKLPFSIVYDLVEFIPARLGDIEDAISQDRAGAVCVNLWGSDNIGQANPFSGTPLQDAPTSESHVCPSHLDDGATAGMTSALVWIRAAMLIVFLCAFALQLWRFGVKVIS